ncbi:hypothetical protein HY374_00935 [Candidatus Berkelbacteria bacterium]|nr:hypothetical protein [Candidatus Berkelbacteria bacterium]
MKTLPTIEQLDHDLTPVLRKMEQRGVLLDVKHLQQLAKKLKAEIDEVQAEIWRKAGHEFTIASPRQLAAVLYDELHLDDGEGFFIRKTKSGKSTAHSELAKIADAHPIIPLILAYREKTKLLSTYVEPLPKQLGEDGRLHTTYRIDTAAGRLSSNNPNLQNIPARTEEGMEIRRAFVAPKGKQLLVVDYSQIDLRVAAHLSGDPALCEVFRKGEDIHAATAEKMNVDRRVAKAINFGVLYGQAAFGLSEALRISYEEAQAFIDEYFATYPKLKDWVASVQQSARDKGYAETLLGRKRYLAEITGKNATLRAFAERVAINHPTQGTTAEIVGLAMVAIDKEIPESDALMLLQVHDELVFEISKKTPRATIQKIRDIMESIVELQVPIKTEAKLGPNWAEMKVID